MKRIKCDVVVVGAGPGGSMAAKTCAKYGLDTVLVERKEKPEKPNATGTVMRRMSEYIKLDEEFVESEIYGMKQYWPDGYEISTQESALDAAGYIVDRKKFDNELAKLAVNDGTKLFTKTKATGLIKEDGKVKGIKARIDGREDIEIRSNIVIGADGVESKVGRWAGVYERLDPNDVFVLFHSIFEDVDLERDDYTYQYFGWQKMQDILYYVAPLKDRKASLITQTYRTFHPTRKGQLFNAENYFIKTHPFFSKAKLIERGGGIVPVNPFRKFLTDNVLLVGDAACQTISLWQLGIHFSMDGGILAGETAVEAHEEEDFSSDFLSRYEKKWYRLHGELNTLSYYILKVVGILPIEQWNVIGHMLGESNSVFTDELFEALFESPKLVSKILNKLKKEGEEEFSVLSFMSLLKKYYRNYWDMFVL